MKIIAHWALGPRGLALELRLWWPFNQLKYTHRHVMQPEPGRECDFLSVQRAVMLLLMCNENVGFRWTEALVPSRALAFVMRLLVLMGVGGAGGWQSYRYMDSVLVLGFPRMAGSTALKGWSANNKAEINSRLHHKSAPSCCPPANTCSTEIWSVESTPHDMCTPTHTLSGMHIHSHSTADGETINSFEKHT